MRLTYPLAARHTAVVAMARSLWFVGPRQVALRDVPLPEVAEGQVRVATRCSGISAGTELLAYRGELDPQLARDETIGALAGTFAYPFPYGYSCVGVVEREPVRRSPRASRSSPSSRTRTAS